MPEDPKDTNTSSKGLKSNYEDHWARTKEKKKNFVTKQEKEKSK